MSELQSIAGGGKPDKMRDEIRKLQSNLDIILEAQNIVAQITRAKYVSLIEQGFTQAQALELCK